MQTTELWSCGHCDKRFSSFQKLKDHNPKKCKNGFVCKFCYKTFDTEKSLFRHKQIHILGLKLEDLKL